MSAIRLAKLWPIFLEMNLMNLDLKRTGATYQLWVFVGLGPGHELGPMKLN